MHPNAVNIDGLGNLDGEKKKTKQDEGQSQFRNRVTERRRVLGADLLANGRNWRGHPKAQTEALRGILSEIGQVGELYAYYSERNGGKLTLIDGHLRSQEFSGETWDVAITDLNDAEADKLLACYDPLAAMATVDAAALASLLREVEVSSIGLADLINDLAESARSVPEPANDARSEYEGMPEFSHEDKTEGAAFTIRVFLNDDAELEEFGKLLGKNLTGKKFVWFRKQPITATKYIKEEDLQ